MRFGIAADSALKRDGYVLEHRADGGPQRLAESSLFVVPHEQLLRHRRFQ